MNKTTNPKKMKTPIKSPKLAKLQEELLKANTKEEVLEIAEKVRQKKY